MFAEVNQLAGVHIVEVATLEDCKQALSPKTVANDFVNAGYLAGSTQSSSIQKDERDPALIDSDQLYLRK